MHRYVRPVSFRPPIFDGVSTNEYSLSQIEIPGEEEEYRQLPPDENVPEGRWPAEEGGCAGLNGILVDNGTPAETGVLSGTVPIGSFGVLSTSLAEAIQDLHADLIRGDPLV